MKIAVKVADSLKYEDSSFRVISINPVTNDLVIIQEEITKMKVSKLPYNVFLQQAKENTFVVVPASRSDKYLNPENKRYKRNLEIINLVVKCFGPGFERFISYGNQSDLITIAEMYGIKQKQLRKLIRNYLQSGMDPVSLYPGYNVSHQVKPGSAKRGPKSGKSTLSITPGSREEEIFQRVLKLRQGNKYYSLTDLYGMMLDTYYKIDSMHQLPDGTLAVESIDMPDELVPSKRQLQHWLETHTTIISELKRNHNALDLRNNYRPQYGDTVTEASHPGYMVSVDDHTFDWAALAADSNDIIGTPNLSIMICNYCHIIPAFDVSLEGNSKIDLGNLLMNLGLDKLELCKEYDIDTITDKSEWPSNFLPSIIRCDNGRHYISEYARRWALENQVEWQPVPAGMGSFKAVAERFFGGLETVLRGAAANHGLVTKDPDSNHKEKAIFSLRDFMKITIKYIILFNHKGMRHYSTSEDMRKKGCDNTPLAIWNYGCKYINYPRQIPDYEEYIWSLLEIDTSTAVFDDGLHFAGLRYISYRGRNDKDFEELMIKAQNGSIPVPIRYDPRDISIIYYVNTLGNKDRLRLKIECTPEIDCWGFSYEKAMAEKKKRDKVNNDNEIRDARMVGRYLNEVNAMVKEAKKKYDLKPNKHDILDNRHIEKESDRANHSIHKRLGQIMDEREEKDMCPDSLPPIAVYSVPETNSDGASMLDIYKKGHKNKYKQEE